MPPWVEASLERHTWSGNCLMDLESTYTEIYTTHIRRMYAGVQQDDVLKGSRGVTKSKSTSAMPPGHGRMFSAANSKTEPDSIHFPSDSILHDFDSLHDSRQRKSWWRQIASLSRQFKDRVVETGQKKKISFTQRNQYCNLLD